MSGARLPFSLAPVVGESFDSWLQAYAARLDVQFHDSIYRAAHHQRLYSAWEQIRMPTYWFMLSRNVASPDWREETVRGHAGLVQVIKNADESPAVEMIKEHISFAYERILRSYLDSTADLARS